MEIHESHVMKEVVSGLRCENCGFCTCHEWDYLEEPCRNEPPKVIGGGVGIID